MLAFFLIRFLMKSFFNYFVQIYPKLFYNKIFFINIYRLYLRLLINVNSSPKTVKSTKGTPIVMICVAV